MGYRTADDTSRRAEALAVTPRRMPNPRCTGPITLPIEFRHPTLIVPPTNRPTGLLLRGDVLPTGSSRCHG
ncbi:MAG: hypothetical protein JWR32_6751 [Mycobacterium sp.]|jgi:hypothetical protein|nr:hypothetical protein [Mycobacterium sp.]